MNWEYKTVRNHFDRELNELGAEGWELVSLTKTQCQVSPHPGNSQGIGYNTEAVFKRKKNPK